MHRAQRLDAVILGVADVEAGIDGAPMQHPVALGAFGMRDRPAPPEEARRIVVGGSARMVDAHAVFVVRLVCRIGPSVRKMITLSTPGYTVESAGFMAAAPN
jgi:hypothetical protein